MRSATASLHWTAICSLCPADMAMARAAETVQAKATVWAKTTDRAAVRRTAWVPVKGMAPDKAMVKAQAKVMALVTETAAEKAKNPPNNCPIQVL